MNEIIENLTIADLTEMTLKFNDIANLIAKNFQNYNAAMALMYGMKEVINATAERLGSQV